LSADIIIPPGLDGDIVQITIRNEDGSLDDLTQYLSVTLTVKSADFTLTPVNGLDVTLVSNSDGTIDWDPNNALTSKGKFWVIVKRIATNVDRPAVKLSLEVTEQ